MYIKMKTTLIIPAYNEDPKILKQIVKKSKKYVDKIIIIDDGSSKNIKIDCTIIKNIKNKGKGFSIRKAIKFVGKSDIIIFMDADNEHDPKDLPKFLNKFKSNKFQGLVIGKRRQYRSPLRKILNNWMNFWIGFIIKKADFSCGFRAIDISSLKKFNLKSNRFEIDLEMILESYLNKIKIVSIDINHKPVKKSHVKFIDYIKLNNFFDRWILKSHSKLNIPLLKKMFLMFFSVIGLIIGSIVYLTYSIFNLATSG